MHSPEKSPPTERPQERLDVSAADLASILAGQVSGLRGMTSGLEDALSASLCSCNPLTEEAFVTFQRIDYMRQALKDIEGLLQEFGPNLDWLDRNVVTREAFSRSVDMGDSIKTMLGMGEDNPPPQADKTDSGELDLW